MSVKRIIFEQTVIEFFESELKKVHLLEKGGILLGNVSDKTLYIEKASSPGTRAIHEPYYFKADPDYIDMFIDMEAANSGGRLRYLGEWHSHLQHEPEPSYTDLESSRNHGKSSSHDFHSHRIQ
jgi:integrative and conjugative element protein (TIGR02256 family)